MVSGKGGLQLTWSYMGELLYGKFPAGTSRSLAEAVAMWLYNRSPKRWSSGDEIPEELSCELAGVIKVLYKKLRPNGLCPLR